MEKNTKTILLIISFLLVPIIIGVSYARIKPPILGSDKPFSLLSDEYEVITYTENDGILNVENGLPIKEKDLIEKANKINFKVVSKKMKQKVNYDLFIEDLEISENLKDKDFKWVVYSESKLVKEGNFKNVNTDTLSLLTNIELDEYENHNYDIYIYIKETNEKQNKLLNGNFKGRVYISLINN